MDRVYVRGFFCSFLLICICSQIHSQEGLRGYYFSNSTLSGTPRLIQVDPQIGFDWASAGPNSILPVDKFSVRWIGSLTPTTTETYTFYLRGDDGIRLWLDGTLLINSWKDQAISEYSTQVPLIAGKNYDLRVEYYENTGKAAVQLLWSSPFISKQVIPNSVLKSDSAMQVGNGNGLRASFYKNINLEGSITASRLDNDINFSWGSGSPAAGVPADYFSIRWQGEVASFFSEDVTFHFTADDGVRLWVDGTLIIDQWKDQSPTKYSATVPMIAGKRVPIRVEYYERGGGANAVLRWSSTQILDSVVPTTQLFSESGLVTTLPAESYVSPVCVEGEHWSANGESYALTGIGGAIPVTATKLTDAVFFTNIPLSSTSAETEVVLSNSSSNTAKTGKVRWLTTDLNGKSLSSGRTVVRLNDSLLFTVSSATKERIRIDADGDGKWDFQGFTSDKLPFTYSQSGAFEALAEMQSPSGWAQIGVMEIVCVQAPLFETPALAGSSRELDVYSHPAEAISELTWTSADPSLRVSVKGTFTDDTGFGSTLTLNTLRRGTPVFVARIGNAQGPILSWAPVQEFTIDIPAMREAVVDAQTGEASTGFVMTPFIEDVRFALKMFAHSSTFPGGLKSISISTNDVNPATGRAYFSVEVDPTTGERVGRAQIDFHVPSGEDMYCFNVQPFIQNPVPKLPDSETVATVASRGTGGKEKSGGSSQNVNGDGCTVDIGSLVLCVGEKGTLPITVQPAKKHGKVLPLSIVNGPTPKPKFTTEPASVNCAPNAPTDQSKEVTAEGAKDGVYDVNCGGKIFSKRITVIKSDGITVVPSTASLCVGETETFKSYACVSGKAQLFDSNWSLAPTTFVEFQGGAPSYPTSQVTVVGKKAGKPTTLTAADPAGKLKSGTASIDVGQFTVDPLYLTQCPGDEGTVTLTQDPKGTVKINSGGSIAGKTKVIVKDGNKDVTNGSVEVGPEGKKLTISFNPAYPVEVKTATITFSPSVPCPDKVVTLTDPGEYYIKPSKVEQCKEASGNSAQFEAFACGKDEKSKPYEVEWSIDNTDFTVSPAKGTKTTVTRKADKPGKVTVTAKKGSTVIGTAEYFVYTIKFTKAPKDTCVSETAQFEAVSDPSGKAVNYSIEGDAKGCTIDASGKFTAGKQQATVTVAATLEGLYDCKVTSQIKVHELKVTLKPETICNKAGSTSQATATLDGSSASPSWTISPADGKVTISPSGLITVVTAPAADTYTVTATDSTTKCKGTAELSLIGATFLKKQDCYGFYDKSEEGKPTQIVCAGGTKIVKVKATGKGTLAIVSTDESKVKVTKPKDGLITAPGEYEIELTGQSLPAGTDKAAANIEARVGSKDGMACETMEAIVLRPVTLKVIVRRIIDGKGKAVDASKFNIPSILAGATDIWEKQACVSFVLDKIEDCTITEASLKNSPNLRKKLPADLGFGDSYSDDEMLAADIACGSRPGKGYLVLHLLPGIDPDSKGNNRIGWGDLGGWISRISPGGADGTTVAHEFGHNFSLEHPGHVQIDLMYESDSGCRLTLKDVLAAHPNAVKK